MLGEALHIALAAIARNALRSLLTILGIVIGVASVIAMVTLGQGSAEQVARDMAKLGTNLLIVRPGQARQGPGGMASAAKPLALGDAEAIEAEIGAVRVAAPAAVRVMTVIFGNRNRGTTIIGTDGRYLVANDWNIAEGRGFAPGEVQAGQAVCLLGQTVRADLFGRASPLGETVRLKQIACRVIGVLAPKGGAGFGLDQDDIVLLPIRAFHRRIAGSREVALIYVAVHQGQSTEPAQRDIAALMRERRAIGPGEDDDFTVFDMKEITAMLTRITGALTGLLSAVAVVSLAVGGIGIMNIMLVSVTERTREIGIRLSVGATEGQVLVQFLVEAVVLSLIGGAVGIAAGLGLGALGAHWLSVPFTPDPGIVALAVAVAMAIGVVFGYLPARRAARLDPIAALRHL